MRRIVGVGLAALLAASARGEPAAAPGWDFTVAPYLWLFNLAGDVGGGGRESSVDTSLIDLYQDNDSVLGVQANFQARNGPWSLLVDPTYLRIQDDFDVVRDIASVDAEATGTLVLIDLMGMREAWRKPLGEPVVEKGMRQRALALHLLAGMRVMIVDTDLDLNVSSPVPELDALERSFGDTESWVDPIIGARATLRPGRSRG